jgi:hypothetical protein
MLSGSQQHAEFCRHHASSQGQSSYLEFTKGRLMIAFDIKCANAHCFEGWFEDAKAYEDQKKAQLIACPICNNTDVSRAPSTFAIKSTDAAKLKKQQAQIDPAVMGQMIVDYVRNNFDDVGPDFAKEALKMHYGVREPRNIRGVSTAEEEKTLKEEGITFFKMPIPDKTSGDDSSND